MVVGVGQDTGWWRERRDEDQTLETDGQAGRQHGHGLTGRRQESPQHRPLRANTWNHWQHIWGIKELGISRWVSVSVFGSRKQVSRWREMWRKSVDIWSVAGRQWTGQRAWMAFSQPDTWPRVCFISLTNVWMKESQITFSLKLSHFLGFEKTWRDTSSLTSTIFGSHLHSVIWDLCTRLYVRAKTARASQKRVDLYII